MPADTFKFKSVHICIFQIYQNIISLKSNLNASYILDHFMNDVTTDNLFLTYTQYIYLIFWLFCNKDQMSKAPQSNIYKSDLKKVLRTKQMSGTHLKNK